ncbi:unnamed protein product [Polarella glacialis]|uniref:Uncharacterized protein n=1 Tax=Polarella glacialis TaxID=89957 RepID=A0A813GAF0_POLGL|nr:unnamed protein product [Polarella glacialis]
MFVDFLSVTQRPFCDGQVPRSPDEETSFKRALATMHDMYFLSDRIIHLDLSPDVIEGQDTVYSAGVEALCGRKFFEFKNAVYLAPVDAAEDAEVIPQSSISVESTASKSSFRSFMSHRRSRNSTISLSDRVVGCGDQVVSVDAKDVKSLTQLTALLASASESAEVKLIRYPFGRPNAIPSNERGWIFLERFITMVKCAMVDPDVAADIVISNSQELKESILRGSERLRQASADERPQEALRKVFASFVSELARKQFSAASADGDQMGIASGGLSEDASVVCAIMTEFIAHLSTSWQADTAKQQRRAAKVARALGALTINEARDYLFTWDAFSPPYQERLAAAKSASRWPGVLLITLPLLPAVASMAFPYAPASDSWEKQGAFFGVLIVACACMYYIFPIFLLSVLGVVRTRKINIMLVAWLFLAGATASATDFVGAVIFQVFPLPLQLIIGAIAGFSQVVWLWWVLPAELRRDPAFRWRFLLVCMAFTLYMIVFACAFLLLNAVLARARPLLQIALTVVYLVGKLMWERFGIFLSKHLGADIMPIFIYTGSVSYETNFCVALAGGVHPGAFAMILGIDAVENIFHLVSMARNPSPKVQQFIMAQTLLREFVEVLVPAQFLLLLTVLRHIQPRYNNLVCSLSDEAFRSLQLVLAMDVAVEAVVFLLVQVVLLYKGLALLFHMVAALPHGYGFILDLCLAAV